MFPRPGLTAPGKPGPYLLFLGPAQELISNSVPEFVEFTMLSEAIRNDSGESWWQSQTDFLCERTGIW